MKDTTGGQAMLSFHLSAETEEDALALAQKEHPHCVIGAVYHDKDWGHNPRRWRVDVYAPRRKDAKNRRDTTR